MGKDLTADRSGHQIYGTIRIKDEIKKDNITLFLLEDLISVILF